MDSVQGGVGGVQSSVDSGAGVTPDLFAGELDAMGRLLHDVAGKLARRALHTQDLQVAAKQAADELRALATQLETPDEVDQRDRLLSLSNGLTKALAKMDERGV